MPRRKSIPKDEVFFTVKEAAERAHVHTSTIRRSIKDGDLVASKIRGTVRIRASSLDEFLFACEQSD